MRSSLVFAALAAASTIFACNIARRQNGAAVESVQSIHHSGKVLLWWSPDGTKFFTKACDEVVADKAIDTLEAMNAACKGEVPAKETTRAVLQPMLVQIANEDSGFAEILKDKGKLEVLAKIKTDVENDTYNAADIQTALEALQAQMTDLTASLAKVQADVTKMKATAEAAAQAAGHPATEDEVDLIFGPAYRDALKAQTTLRGTQGTTKAAVDGKLKAYADVQKAIAEANGRLDLLAKATLDRIADRSKVFTVSLLQKENFEFALLETAAMRLGLLTSHAPETVTCKQVCEDASPFADQARCYSCRCKEALGGLPGPDVISCSNAKQMQVYKLKPIEGGFDLEEQKQTVDTCWNPSLLYGDCQYGSKLGQTTVGNTHFKWICRHRSNGDMNDKDATYDDVGVIALNMDTGASCWWDDYGGKISDKYFPKLDLTSATQKEIDGFKSVFYNTTGEGCTGCHDNDPFMFTPYLRSTEWKTEGYTDAKYSTVQYDGSLRKVGHAFLASDEASECTSCHRIASSSTCASWAKQSMGIQKRSGFEQPVYDAVDTVGADGKRQPGVNWQLAYWMPPTKGFPKGTWEKWHEKNAGSKDMVIKCCANPKAAGCKWVDSDGKPSEPDGTLQELPSGPVAPPAPIQTTTPVVPAVPAVPVAPVVPAN